MLSPEPQDRVQDYLARLISIETLVEWLAPRELDMLRDPGIPKAGLMSAIELGLAEMKDGVHTETHPKVKPAESDMWYAVRGDIRG